MANKKILIAVLVVIAVILIAVAAWYYAYRYHTILVPSTADGGTVSLSCQAGQAVKVVTASYTPPGEKAVNVAANLQTILNALSGASYTINGQALGQKAGGTLTFRYRCEGPSKANFRPVPISTCGSPYDDHYAVDMTGRNAAGTVVWDPYSTQSRVSLERYAETPEAAEQLNPYTGIGKTSSVRALGDRYRRHEALQRLSIYELQPGQPGYMEEVDDGAMSLMTQVARRPPAASAGPPPCLAAGGDMDSEFYTDGPFGAGALKETQTLWPASRRW